MKKTSGLCRKRPSSTSATAGKFTGLAQAYRETGEPIVRYMEYVFPHQGLAAVTDQFMLGEDVLVAPVLEKGARERRVVFPAGVWRGADGTRVTGPCERTVAAGLERSPCLNGTERKGLVHYAPAAL